MYRREMLDHMKSSTFLRSNDIHLEQCYVYDLLCWKFFKGLLIGSIEINSSATELSHLCIKNGPIFSNIRKCHNLSGTFFVHENELLSRGMVSIIAMSH